MPTRRLSIAAFALFLCALLSAAAIAAGGATAAAPSPSRVLVVQVTWEGDERIGPPFELRFHDLLFGRASALAAEWFEQASDGAVGKWSTAVGAVTIETPPVRAPDQGEGSVCDESTFEAIANRGEKAIEEVGFDVSSFDRVVYGFVGTPCHSMPDPRDYALLDDRRVVVQAFTDNFANSSRGARTLIEAFGHTMGLEHAPAIRCRDASGEPVPLSTACTVDPRGDAYDVMGSGETTFNAIAQEALGWIDSTEITEVDAARSPVVDLPLDPAAGGFGSTGRHAVRLRDGQTTLWLESRLALGFDSSDHTEIALVPGIVIHREVPSPVPGRPPISQLLDMTPQTPQTTDAALVEGRSWSNPLGSRQITVSAESATTLTVHIEGQRSGPAPEPEPQPDPAPGEIDPWNSVLVLNVGWDAPVAEEAAPLREELLTRAMEAIEGPVKEWYLGSSPHSPLEVLDPTAGGSFEIAPPDRSGVDECHNNDDYEDFFGSLRAEADSEAEQAGVVPGAYAHVLYVYSNGFCLLNGAQDPGRHTFIGPYERDEAGIAEVPTIADTARHELGHHFGLRHADAIRCHGSEGVVVTLSRNCTRIPVGDPFDQMGEGTGAFNPSYANALGWLDHQFSALSPGDYSKTFELQPFVGEERPVEGWLRALRLDDGGLRFWLEYRQPVGPDRNLGKGPVKPGLYIRREVIGDSGWPITHLLDMTPLTDSFSDAALKPGETWINPVGSMQVTLVSGGPSGAFVRVSRQPRTAVPDLSGDDLAQAAAELRQAGLVYGGESGLVEDFTCVLVGRVAGQSPSPGTNVVPGSKVTVKMGVRPTKGDCL